MPGPPGRTGSTQCRSEPVAHHDRITGGGSAKSDRDRSHRPSRGARQPGRRRAREPHEGPVSGDIRARTADAAGNHRRCRATPPGQRPRRSRPPAVRRDRATGGAHVAADRRPARRRAGRLRQGPIEPAADRPGRRDSPGRRRHRERRRCRRSADHAHDRAGLGRVGRRPASTGGDEPADQCGQVHAGGGRFGWRCAPTATPPC